MAEENLVTLGFIRPKDLSLTENSNQDLFPGLGEYGSFLYAIKKVKICNFV